MYKNCLKYKCYNKSSYKALVLFGFVCYFPELSFVILSMVFFMIKGIKNVQLFNQQLPL